MTLTKVYVWTPTKATLKQTTPHFVFLRHVSSTPVGFAPPASPPHLLTFRSSPSPASSTRPQIVQLTPLSVVHVWLSLIVIPPCVQDSLHLHLSLSSQASPASVSNRSGNTSLPLWCWNVGLGSRQRCQPRTQTLEKIYIFKNEVKLSFNHPRDIRNGCGVGGSLVEATAPVWKKPEVEWRWWQLSANESWLSIEADGVEGSKVFGSAASSCPTPPYGRPQTIKGHLHTVHLSFVALIHITNVQWKDDGDIV